MKLFEFFQIFFFLLILCISIPLLGGYMAKIFSGQRTVLHPILSPLERFTYRIASIDPQKEMGAAAYLKALLLFTLLCFLFLFFLQCFQHILPLNPQHFPAMPWPLAFNTAASFVTNTNWQAYSGETTMSYATQMMGLTVQNFVSPATGIASVLVLIRGVKAENLSTLGNFWVDIVRTIIYLLLPLSIPFALFLVSQGAVQTLSPYVSATTIEGAAQTLALGPVASQEAIKQLGSNGGGFFATNSAHPFENPTSASNFLELLAILLIPAALIYSFGLLVGDKKHAALLLLCCFILLMAGLAVSVYSERIQNPLFPNLKHLEGKEMRFGTINDLLWSVSTTATANGSANCALDSLSPLAGGVALLNIMLGELIFGGVGVGLASLLMFVLLTLYFAGLMVGKMPDYMGKKLEKREMQWVCASILTPCVLTLFGSGFSIIYPKAVAALGNGGPHGLSEMIYTFCSPAGNNGSSFAALNADTTYFNIFLGLVMIIGRLAIIVPSVAIGALLAAKKNPPSSIGIWTNSFLFLFLLLGIIIIIGALSYFPALCLGPILEHLSMLKGESF